MSSASSSAATRTAWPCSSCTAVPGAGCRHADRPLIDPRRARKLCAALASRDDLVMDQGGADAFLPTRTLDRDAMLALERSMVRRFYLRPSYLLRRNV